MTNYSDFEFLSSDIWLKYTQKRYVSLKDIKFRTGKLGQSPKKWAELKEKVQFYRQLGAVPFILNSIQKKFWYFPSDSINQKVEHIEKLGDKLFTKISAGEIFAQEFFNNALIEESITSAIYEGANSTRADARALIASGERPKNKDEWMLINNYLTMRWIKYNLHLQISTNLICQIHRMVTQNTLEGDDENFSGKFRNDEVFVGKHQGIQHLKIENALNESIELVSHHPRHIHSLIRGIISHYLVAYIHPFFDGNGRTARALFYLNGMKSNLHWLDLLSISAFLKEHRKQYEKAFELVIEHNLDLTYFIDFCLDSLVMALTKVEQKINYVTDISKLSQSLDLGEDQIGILQCMALNKHKELSIESYAEKIGKSREIARLELKDLMTKGLVTEKKMSKKFVYKLESKILKKLLFKSVKGK